MPKHKVEDYVGTDGYGHDVHYPRYEETLPNGVKYLVLDSQPFGALDSTGIYTVLPGHYFMMGDNRDNSTDSRVTEAVGPVPIDNFVGRAQVVFFSIDERASVWRFWEWPVYIRWSRIFDITR